MNTRTLVAALVATVVAVTLSTSALAADASPGYPQAYTSQVSRAQVQQATLAARAQGQLPHGEQSVVVGDFESMKTRAQVHAEAIEAIRVGAISHGELNAVPTAMQLDSIRMAGEHELGMKIAGL